MAKGADAFAVNDRVSHSSYGPGTISQINPWHTIINFDGVGAKKFITSMVQLEPSGTPMPPPAKRKARTTKK